jgi:inosose dehydratase
VKGVSRRGFVRSALAAGAGALAAPLRAADALALQLGCAAITWGAECERAVDEIAALGFRGIQLRASDLEAWGGRPDALRRRLDEKGLSLLCFSSGDVDAVPEREHEYLEAHVRNARFVKAAGGNLLQVISRRPAGRAPTPAEFERLGRLLGELGRRTLELDVRLVYHHHMGGFGEAPDEVAQVLAASDARTVWLLLDVAHYLQGGGDPADAVARHRDRLAALHLKDVVGPLPGDARPARQSYRFVELGRGRADLPAVVAALRRVGFRGPALIELDEPPDPARSPSECAATSKRYAVETLGLSL